MNDELLSGSLDSGNVDNDHIDTTETENTETVENGAELAPASDGKQTKTDDGLFEQENVKKAINKQHAKYREEERKRIAIEKEAGELKERLAKMEAEKGEVTIPPVPDPYDEDFETQLAAREEAIKRQAEQNAQKQNVIATQDAQKEAAAQAEQERVTGLVNNYTQQITKLGLSAEEIRIAGDTVVNNGIDPMVAEYILADSDGPLITKYLADNPIKQDDLRNLPPIEQAMFINSTIRAAASVNKPQTSSAPDPVDVLAGNGIPEKTSPLIAGGKFE